jgi:hypothetical protein
MLPSGNLTYKNKIFSSDLFFRLTVFQKVFVELNEIDLTHKAE